VVCGARLTSGPANRVADQVSLDAGFERSVQGVKFAGSNVADGSAALRSA
jgi:hypothetical protein